MSRLLTLLFSGLLAIYATSAAAQTTGIGNGGMMEQMTKAFGPNVPTPAALPAAAPAAAPSSAAQANPPHAKPFDYSINLNSDVFGAQLFTGAFAKEGATQFNPDYVVAVGDKLQIRMWGAFDLDSVFVVDPKGNIFLPHIGPVRVLGIRNQDLQASVEASARKVFKANVYIYASLAAAQPVRVFVSGFVNRPGLYSGTSMDSLLHYIDQAGGIDVERGSFLDVQVKRDGQVRARANLYEFLLNGRIPLTQLNDGDVIFIPPRQNVAKVFGLVENAKRFEFTGDAFTVADIAKMAKPWAKTTNVRIARNTGNTKNTEYYHIDEAAKTKVGNGDEVEFTSDQKPGTISVRVEGEHQSAQEYVLPYGSRLGDLMSRIQYNERSDPPSLQLFRQSVKERQKQMLLTSLKSLESAALTARSGTGEEAALRRAEADMLLQWVERAKTIEPLGQVFMADSAQRNELLLENGDVLRVPTKDGLVLISGEVLFPNAIAFDANLSLNDYINRAGGYTQNSDVSRVIVAHRDGSFADAANGGDLTVRQGDQILVLPKIDTKSRQFALDISRILASIAIAAKVVFDL